MADFKDSQIETRKIKQAPSWSIICRLGQWRASQPQGRSTCGRYVEESAPYCGFLISVRGSHPTAPHHDVHSAPLSLLPSRRPEVR